MGFLYKEKEYNSGDFVTASIKGVNLFGRINITDLYDSDGMLIHLCHNNSSLSGSRSPDLHGFKYSWGFRIRGGLLSDGVEIFNVFEKSSEISISEDLLDFFDIVDPSLSYMVSNLSRIKNFNRLESCDNLGMVKLLNIKNNKSAEMKFGRLIRSIDIDNINRDVIDITDKYIESLHNKYLIFQKGEIISIDELNGLDILSAYESKNHITTRKGNLRRSCMNDKLGFLGIYTNNKDIVSLLVVKQYDMIAGRAVIWNLPDGRRAIDRRYVSGDWATEKIRKYTTDNGLINVDDLDDIDIEIDVTGLSEFPYLDTFFYVNIEEGSNSATISNYDDDCQKFFRSTEGHLQNRN